MKRILNTLALLVNLLVILFFVLLKLGGKLSPSQILLPAYISLALQPLIIINALLLIYWILMRKKRVIIPILTMLLFYPTFQTGIPLNFSKKKIKSTESPIRILSYNTMTMAEMKKHKDESPNNVVQYILDSEADIVCLQEFAVSRNNNQFTNADFERNFKMYPYKHVSYKLNKWRMNIGLATLSKYPIIEKRNIDYTSDFNLSMFTDIVINEDTIRVVNNHLESNRITSQDMKSTSELVSDFSSEQFKELGKYLSRKMAVAYRMRAQQVETVTNLVEKTPYKVIVCGDFNDVPSSYTYSELRGNMKDAFVESGRGLGWTFAQSYYRFRIDYILHDKSFRSTNYKQGNLRDSDHYPIQCDIYLN